MKYTFQDLVGLLSGLALKIVIPGIICFLGAYIILQLSLCGIERKSERVSSRPKAETVDKKAMKPIRSKSTRIVAVQQSNTEDRVYDDFCDRYRLYALRASSDNGLGVAQLLLFAWKRSQDVGAKKFKGSNIFGFCNSTGGVLMLRDTATTWDNFAQVVKRSCPGIGPVVRPTDELVRQVLGSDYKTK
jgi:hypothetical protein